MGGRGGLHASARGKRRPQPGAGSESGGQARREALPQRPAWGRSPPPQRQRARPADRSVLSATERSGDPSRLLSLLWHFSLASSRSSFTSDHPSWSWGSHGSPGPQDSLSGHHLRRSLAPETPPLRPAGHAPVVAAVPGSATRGRPAALREPVRAPRWGGCGPCRLRSNRPGRSSQAQLVEGSRDRPAPSTPRGTQWPPSRALVFLAIPSLVSGDSKRLWNFKNR